MMEITTKDKLFLAFALPAALAAGYWHFWRVDAAKNLASLESTHATLVQVEDYPMEKRRAETALADAQAALEAEKRLPRPESKVEASKEAGFAERERAVLDVFTASGLVVMRSEKVDPATEADGVAQMADAIADATAWQGGWRAECRKYILDGTYPAVKRALDAFAARKMAVIPSRAEMRENGNARWTLEVWL